jgi:hypothetical protein
LVAKTVRRRSVREVGVVVAASVAGPPGGGEEDELLLEEEEEDEDEEEAEQTSDDELSRAFFDIARIALAAFRLLEHETPPPELRRAAKDAEGSTARGAWSTDPWAGGSGGNERRIEFCFFPATALK